MLGYVVPIVVVLCAFWVYFDATANKVGKVPEANGMFNMAAGGWAAVTLFLWIVGFPAYLIKRRALIRIATEKPVESKLRPIGFGLLVLGGAAVIALNVAMFPAPELPECDSRDVSRLLASLPAMKPLLDAGAALTSARQASYDPRVERRICTVVLAKGDERLPVTYAISWQDRSGGRFWLQIVQ